MCRKDKGGETVDRTEERILEYALDGITRELRVLDKNSECYKELHEFYIQVYDEYEKEIEKNIL